MPRLQDMPSSVGQLGHAAEGNYEQEIDEEAMERGEESNGRRSKIKEVG